MRHLSAAVALSLSCAFFAISCVQSPEAPPETDPGEAQNAYGPEPIGEAQDPFTSKSFLFVEDVKDDGEGKGGGWQKASASLKFVRRHWGIPVHSWQCPLVVGMPLRTEREGHIPPDRAARVSAQIATAVAGSLSQDWEGPDALFCIKLRAGMQQMFALRYPGIGAKVSQQ